MKKKIIFRLDASNKVGYGHFMRCLSIAQELEKNYKFSIYFIINKKNKIKNYIKNKSNLFLINDNIKKRFEEIYIYRKIKKLDIDFIFFDIKKNYSSKFLTKLNDSKTKLITIDDKYKKRLTCDLCFYPPVPQVKKMSWKDFKGKKFIGWNYIPLRMQFNKLISPKYNSKQILILSGGTSNKNFSYKILRIMNEFKSKLNIIICLGFNSKIEKKFHKIIKLSQHKVKLINNRFFISKIINQSKLIISSFGISAYEICSQQKKSLLFTKNEDDRLSASIFQKNKLSMNIHNFSNFNEKIFNSILNDSNKKLSKQFNKIAKDLRNGSHNVAKIINEN